MKKIFLCSLFACILCTGRLQAEESLDKNQVAVKVDNVITLVASITPANATNKSVVWTSDAPTITSVDAAGKVTTK